MAEASMVTKRLECKNIKKSYDSTEVLGGVDISLDRGETLAIMGRSGGGKTTLLKCINLIEAPTSGEAFVEGQQYMRGGQPLFEPAQIRSRIGMVFQDF